MTASWLRENLMTYFSVLRGMANANIHRCHLRKSSLAAWINFEMGLYFDWSVTFIIKKD